MAERYDAIVIGAGIIGTATGYELAKAGYKTINIDKGPAAGYGSTSASCAIIRVHYSTWDGTAFAYEGYFDWKDWQGYLNADSDEGLAKFIECGCVVMRTDENNLLNKHVSLCDQLEIPYEIWDEAKITEKMPILELSRYAPAKALNDPAFGEPTGGRVIGGVYFPTAGYINDPAGASKDIQAATERVGGTFKFNAEIVEILQADGRVSGVKLADGSEIHAPIVVNVAGPHSSIINKMAGADQDMTITTSALRQEVTHVPSPTGFDFENNGFVMSDSDISCYSRPETGNHILVGSEDPECDPREIVDPDDYETEFTEQWTVQARRYAQRVPTLGIPGQARGVVSLYDVTEDWIPIYDKSALPGFYMACGSSGNQFKNAPVAGRMMAGLIKYCEEGGDHDNQPYEFKLDRIGETINVGFYSRKREINPESSFSVLG